jgi:chromosome segregation ATPase
MTNKEAYLKKAHAKLDEWNADLDKINAKLSAADADARIKLNESIKALEAQRNEMKQKLDELERAGEDAWEDIRDGMESAWDRVALSIKDAMSRFK